MPSSCPPFVLLSLLFHSKILKQWYEKKNIFIYSSAVSSFCISILCRNPKPIHSLCLSLSVTSPYPFILYPASCLSALFSIFLLQCFPLSNLPLSHSSSTIPFSHFPLLGVFCSRSFCSHYIDGSDDSLEWCTFSFCASPRPFSCSPVRQKSFLCGHHDCMAPATRSRDSSILYIDTREINIQACSLFNLDSRD